jgi:MSHA biogenesis protein MshJ
MKETKSASSLAKLALAFDQLKGREQKLLFIVIPATIFFVVFLLFIEPKIKTGVKLDANMVSLNKQLELAKTSSAELLIQADMDPNTEIKQQIASLEAQLNKLNIAFDGELNQLVAPQAMPVLLEQLFDKANGLSLVKMQSVSPVVIFDGPNGIDQEVIYQHGIEITFEGSFFDTRDFLVSAENLEWKLYWQDLVYQVNQHPRATTTLSLFTLSTSEAFIGVY